MHAVTTFDDITSRRIKVALPAAELSKAHVCVRTATIRGFEPRFQLELESESLARDFPFKSSFGCK